MQSTHFSFERFLVKDDEDSPPPVPPKDPQYIVKMDTRTATTSKRKRTAGEEVVMDQSDDELHTPIDDRHTPKRPRSTGPRSESALSDDPRTRSIRRKKGVRNLSNLNLRHAAKQQDTNTTPRMSKFQEGSLTDKPSVSPPSMFTRFTRTDSGSVQQIDTLMADYHDPTGGNEHDEHGPNGTQDLTEASESVPVRKEGPKSMFKFGKSLTKFYPFALWNKIYDEQHERLLQENIAKAKLKAQLKAKAEAEARYAEMKRTGQFDPTFVSTQRLSGDVSTPNDSVIGLNHEFAPNKHQRNISSESEHADSHVYFTDLDEGEFPATEQKPLRHSVSRFSLRKPSLSNFRNSLKRVASDLNLGYHLRQETAFISPEKTNSTAAGLGTPATPFDLQDAKADRLFRRVSDLERQLQIAREQLSDALDAASMPSSSTKSRHFTPTVPKKRKWVPGGLPTLPSERLLHPEGLDPADIEDDNERIAVDQDMEQGTSSGPDIKAAQGERIPSHGDIEVAEGDLQQESPAEHSKDTSQDELAYKSEVEQISSEGSEMDTIAVRAVDDRQASTLDAKSVALDAEPADAQAKAVGRQAKSKKRKSGVDEQDKAYRPGAGDDDEAEWDGATPKPKKKVKGSGKAEGAGRASVKASPARSKVVKLKTSPKTSTAINAESVKVDDPVIVAEGELIGKSHHENAHGAAVELAGAGKSQTHSEYQDHGLEPVYEEEYEEEEETTVVPLKDEPSRPTATATPARFSSPKPHSSKRLSDIANVIRAGEVAKKRHRGRTTAPPPVEAVVDETFSAVPGKDGVPRLPRGANGSFESIDELAEDDVEVEVVPIKRTTASRANAADGDRQFEWPEDVF